MLKKNSVKLTLLIIVLVCSIGTAGEQGIAVEGLQYSTNPANSSKPMRVHIIKINSDKSTLIESPTGFVTLIGAGDSKYNGEIVRDYLKKYGISRVDLMIQGGGSKYDSAGLKEIIKSKIKVGKVLYNDAVDEQSFNNLAKSKADSVLPLVPGAIYKLGGRAKLRCVYVNGKKKKGTYQYSDYLQAHDRDACFVLDYRKHKTYLGGSVNSSIFSVGPIRFYNIAEFIADDIDNVDVMVLNSGGVLPANSRKFLEKLKPEYAIAVFNRFFEEAKSKTFPDYTEILETTEDLGITLINNNQTLVESKYSDNETGLVLDGESIIITVPKKKEYYINSLKVPIDEKLKGGNKAPEVEFYADIEGNTLHLDPSGTFDEDGIQRVYYVVQDNGKTLSLDTLEPQDYVLKMGDLKSSKDIWIKMYAFDNLGKQTSKITKVRYQYMPQPSYKLIALPNKVILDPVDNFYLDVFLMDDKSRPCKNFYISGGGIIGEATLDTGYTDANGHVRLFLKANTYPHTQIYNIYVVARREKDGDIIARETIQLMVSDVY